MWDSNVEIDPEALEVIVQLIKLGVDPEEIYSAFKQIAPNCGLLKKFKLKPPRTKTNN